jgi:hypothetical protein
VKCSCFNGFVRYSKSIEGQRETITDSSDLAKGYLSDGSPTIPSWVVPLCALWVVMAAASLSGIIHLWYCRLRYDLRLDCSPNGITVGLSRKRGGPL